MKNSKILICAILCVFTLSSCNVSATHPHNEVVQEHEQIYENDKHSSKQYEANKPWPYFWRFYGIAVASLAVIIYGANALK